MFRFIILVIILGLQLLLYIKVRRWVQARGPRWRHVHTAIISLFVFFDASMVALLLLRLKVTDFPGWLLAITMKPFYIWHGATMILGVIILAGMLIVLPLSGIRGLLRVVPGLGPRLRKAEAHPVVQHFDASRRIFIRRTMYGLTAASFGGAAYGVLREKSDVDFTRTDVTIANLPEALGGFTIAMVSDIHSSPFMSKTDMDVYVGALLSVNADMIVVPGDFVNSMTEEVYPFAEAFSALKAPHGVYGVMGNHDFFSQDPERVARVVEEAGVKLLRNDAILIEKNGSSFYLIGIEDTGRHERAASFMETSQRNTPRAIPRILMSHRPYFIEEAAGQKIDLVLSGHTHGGQVVLGRIGNFTITPAQFASPYVWGSYRHGATQMFVSRGIGTVGLPMRINCPPEVVVITLTRA